jgi:hypothetical protein
MRSPLEFVALTALWCSSLAAQEPVRPARFVLAVGPAWTQVPHLPGVQLGVQYDLARYRWFGLQLDAGGYWQPTQSYSLSSPFATVEGTGQSLHVHVGSAAKVTPFPRAWISPYGLMGIAAVQLWTTGVSYYRTSTGSVASVTRGSGTSGELRAFMGLGLRLRFGDRPVQLEMRRFSGIVDAFTLGTALRF